MNKKRFLRPKVIAAFAVAVIFALSGLIGGAFSPIIRTLAAAATGDYNKVVSNMNIENLPRQNLRLGTKFVDTAKGANIPTAADGIVRLFQTSNSGDVEITFTPTGTYNKLGTYEWRFYTDEAAPEDRTLVHRHQVTVYQDNYSISVQTSGAERTTVEETNTTNVFYMPNVSVPNMPVTLPLPSEFTNRTGVNLFTKDEESTDLARLKQLRKEVIDGWSAGTPAMIKPAGWDALTADQKVSLDNFKALIYANTQVKLHGTDTDDYTDGTRYVSGVFSGHADAETNPTEYGDGVSHRTFVPKVAGEYYAEYDFRHPSIAAKYRHETPISVESTGKTLAAINGTSNEAGYDAAKNQIRYETPLKWVTSLGSTAFTINEAYTLPLPTVTLATGTDLTADDYQPVKFSTSSVTSYTYMTVEYFDLNDSQKGSDGEYTEEYLYYAGLRIDETNGYTFTPKHAGRYNILYHTTTPFGIGYTGFYPSEAATVTDGGVTFITYYPHSSIRITQNTVRPETKWSVPFKYVVADNAEPKSSEVKLADIIDFNEDITVGDAVVVESGYEAFFGDSAKKGSIIERKGSKNYFESAANLGLYMPGTGVANTNTPLTQVSNNKQFVIPALLGFNNMDSGKALQYTVTLTRYTSGANPDTIQFRSSTETASSDSKAFPYDNTKPLVLNFGDYSTQSDSKSGYAEGGYLHAWANSSQLEMYQITVQVRDNSNEIIGDDGLSGITSTPLNYIFNVVDDRGADSGNQYLMDTSKPEMGSLSLMQVSYYEEDIISFQGISVADKYTLSDAIEVKYYIVGDFGASNATDYIEIDKSYNKTGNTYTFELNYSNPKAVDILNTLNADGSGMLELQIVAVAKNYFALMNEVDGTFKPTADVFDTDKMLEYLEGTVTADEMKGITASAFPIKLYNLIQYGEFATIGMGADIDATVDDMNTIWTASFGGTDEDSKQYAGKVTLPTIRVGYPDAATSVSYRTTVAFEVILPVRKDSIGLDNYTTKILPIKGGENVPFDDLTFTTTEIGIHTFIARVYNGGGEVSILTATINVVGSPVTEAEIRGGVKEMRVAEKQDLPWVEVWIDGKPFTTNDNGEIVTNYENPAPASPAVAKGTPVGNFAISARSIGKRPVPGNITNFFIPVAADTYVFTYELNIYYADLQAVGISASAPAGAPVTTHYTVRKEHTIIVSGLNESDIGISMQQGYESLDNATGVDGSGKTVEITKDNILPQMVSDTASDVSVGLAKLNNGMEKSVDGSPKLSADGKSITGWNDDQYSFGRIYLPNMNAQWAAELSQLYVELPKVSQVTVAHSRTPNEYKFNSALIGDTESPEKQYVDIADDGRYYYFQPDGAVYVTKPTATPVKTNSNGPNDQTGEPTGTEAYVARDTEDGKWYAWNDEENAWYRYDFDYSDTNTEYQDSLKELYGYRTSNLVNRNVTPDGIYIVTYTITFGGITSTREFRIAVGDTRTPIIEFADGEEENLFRTYEQGEWFTINSDVFRIDPNSSSRLTELEDDNTYARWYVGRNMTVEVLRPDGYTTLSSTELVKDPSDDNLVMSPYVKAIAGDQYKDEWGYKLDGPNGNRIELGDDLPAGATQNRNWTFQLTESGTYRISFTIKSASDMETTIWRNITVNVPTAQTTISPETVWGTILIILACGLLLGVVVYFIQTGRKTKFASSKVKGKKAQEPIAKNPDGVV